MSEIKLNLCEVYFSIIKKRFKTEINIDELCKLSKISMEDAEAVLPKFQRDYNVFFLKILLAKLDEETLKEFKEEISYDTVSNVYEKILEGIILRFDKYLSYQPIFKILSEGFDLRAKFFCQLFKNNQSFMFDLLNIVEGSENKCKLLLKSVALNLVYSRTVDVFLKEENSNLDATIRYLDQYLHEIEDLGYMFGIIKK
ncbi:MAG: hypothetical protein O3A39_10115 [Proteobacteria bacterium]|nr:hypothetical protein [Pseudomonadota bacterium]MDA1134950.1 hypothetical protein [Pseudomonadota bacterium]